MRRLSSGRVRKVASLCIGGYSLLEAGEIIGSRLKMRLKCTMRIVALAR